MSTRKIIELRNLLEGEMEKLLRKGGALDTDQLIKQFKVDQVAEVQEVSEQLLDIALRKLVGDIRQRKKLSLLSESQQALFADFRGLRQSFVLKNEKGRKVEKTIAAMTVGELDEWLHTEAKPTSRLEKNATEADLLNFVMPFAKSMDEKIEHALKNAKAGLKPSKKKA